MDFVLPFEPRGSAKLIFDGPHARERECVIAGPAGTGKSRAALELAHLRALKYPGARILLCRKHRTDLISAAVQTFKDFVLHERDGVMFVGASGDHPGEYRYPKKNGKQSTITLGGLDKDAKNVMSREFDMIYVQECTEITENDWENLTSRLRGVAMPYVQLLGDCNPDAPTHWIKQRADAGALFLYATSHKDNPLYWDDKLNQWTARGRDYVFNILGALTGHRRSRLLEGKWVAAEGQIYTIWDPAAHVVDAFPIPDDWPRYHVVDFGGTNPFFYGWFAEDNDGRLYLYRQIYMSHRIVEDHAKVINAFNKAEPAPQIVICDHDMEDRMTLERHTGLMTSAADKAPNSVRNGIQLVEARLRLQRDGRPRLYIFRADSRRGYGLVQRDEYLVQAKKPMSAEEEFESYIWRPDPNGLRGDEPLKKDDHAMDGIRYVVQYLDSGSPMSWAQTDDEGDWYMAPEYDKYDYTELDDTEEDRYPIIV